MTALRTAVIAAVVALASSVLALSLFGGGGGADLVPMGVSSAGIQRTNNGDKLVVASGGEIEAQSGSTIDFQSGSSVTGAVANDLDGSALILDPGGTSKVQATANFAPIITVGGTPTAASLRVNDSAGTPIAVLRGGAGQSQFPGPLGALDLDGAIDLDGVITNAEDLEHILFPTWHTTAFTYTAAAGGTVTLATIGAGEEWLVHGVWLEVTTNFDATGDDAVLTIGDGNDADGFCVLADAELQAADTEGTGWSAGWQCQVAATRGVFQDGTGGFIYDEGSTETIDAFISASGNDLSAGAATAHILYTRLQ